VIAAAGTGDDGNEWMNTWPRRPVVVV